VQTIGTGAQPAKLCSCTGIRGCSLCSNPDLRKAHGLHPLRAGLGVSTRLLQFESLTDGSFVLHEEGHIISQDELQVPFEGFECIQEVVRGGVAAEASILQEIEAWPWQPSQSGRWKQDFGPRANFKKQLVKVPDNWHGFPKYAREILNHVRGRSAKLTDFEPVECLLLKYETERGANHALHIDDTWLWGERIVGVSLASSSVFTFYEPVGDVAVRVILPPRSAYIISGCVRFDWHHGIFIEDIEGTRVALTFRELTQELAATEVGQLAMLRAQGTVGPPSQEATSEQ